MHSVLPVLLSQRRHGQGRTKNTFFQQSSLTPPHHTTIHTHRAAINRLPFGARDPQTPHQPISDADSQASSAHSAAASVDMSLDDKENEDETFGVCARESGSTWRRSA